MQQITLANLLKCNSPRHISCLIQMCTVAIYMSYKKTTYAILDYSDRDNNLFYLHVMMYVSTENSYTF